MKVGFAGSGNMAAAMARGWAAAARAEGGGPEQMLFTDAGSGRAARLATEVQGEAVEDNAALVEGADLVVLAVKPAGLGEVAPDLAPGGKPIISLLGATSLGTLGEALPGLPLARVMPNLGVELRQGVLCLALPEDADPGFRQQVVGLLEPLGTLFELEDELIDAATAVMGCTPGYLALIAEVLSDAGVSAGLDPDQADAMVARSMAATGALLEEHDADELRRAVASPGGSTEAGLETLERGGLRDLLNEAVDASLSRMRG